MSFLPIALEIKVSQSMVDDEAVKDRLDETEKDESLDLIDSENKKNYGLW